MVRILLGIFLLIPFEPTSAPNPKSVIPSKAIPIAANWLKDAGEIAKTWSEVAAYSSAGLFLVYKLLSGYFITDLSLKIGCERFAPDSTDHLAVTAFLKKGDKGAIRIHDARVRITDTGGAFIDEQAMVGIERLSFNTDPAARMTVTFGRLSKTPWLSLPPGDETQFAAHFDLPTGTVCIVEVAVLGRKLWGGRTAQWRASAVSFPKI